MLSSTIKNSPYKYAFADYVLGYAFITTIGELNIIKQSLPLRFKQNIVSKVFETDL